MPKVHKNKTPTPLRPVMSTVNTKLCYLSKWVTKVLKDETTKVSTYTKDTEYLIYFINQINIVEKNEYLCDADATAMFPSIDTEEGMAALLISYETKLVKHTKNLPIKQLIRASHLLMKHNMFRSGNTYYRQKDGTAIGAPPATD